MDGKRLPKRIVLVSLALMVSGIAWIVPKAEAAGTSVTPPQIEVAPGSKITANVDNSRLGEVLRLMAEKRLFEIQGRVPSMEEISVHFSDLPLEEALKKLLRGYNYVLFQAGEARPPSLMVMGRATSGGGGSFGPAASASAASASVVPAMSGPIADQAAISAQLEGMPERPVKTRRALPTKLATHLASYRAMAFQNQVALSAAAVEQVKEAPGAGGLPGEGVEMQTPGERPAIGPLEENPVVTQPERVQAGEQAQ